MNPKRLIAIDQIFKPIYWLLVGLKGWIPTRKNNPERYLVMKFFGLGSITRIVYVIEQLDIPKDQIVFVTLKKNREIMEFLGVKSMYINNANFFVLIGNTFSTIFKIWKTRNAVILDLERSSNMAGIFRIITSIRKPCSSYYFEEKNKEKGNQKFISLREKSAIDGIAEMFGQNLTQPGSVTLKTEKKENKVFVNINAGDYLPERMFPHTQYSELLLKLHQSLPNAKFVLTGGKSEVERVETFRKELLEKNIPQNAIHNLAGTLSITEMAKELKSARLFITNDSGPLHLSHYLGTKTVCIWGPTSAEMVGYPASELMLNLVPNESCHPCFVHPKSTVAMDCEGALTCFKSMEIEQMKNAIIHFAANE